MTDRQNDPSDLATELCNARSRRETTGEFGNHVQNHDGENESHGQKQHHQWIHAQALSLVGKELQHRSGRAAGASSPRRQRQLRGLLGLFVRNVFSFDCASQATGGRGGLVLVDSGKRDSGKRGTQKRGSVRKTRYGDRHWLFRRVSGLDIPFRGVCAVASATLP